MTLRGIDISVWQQQTPDLTGIDFVLVRAAYGDQRDPLYDMHAANVRRAGKVLIAFTFGRYMPGALQAARLLEIAPTADGWALDFESDSKGLQRITFGQGADWVNTLHASGRRCGLYASELLPYPSLGQDWRWVANTSREPVIPWDIHQWTEAVLDRDRFRGSLDDLHLLLAGGDPMITLANLTCHESVGVRTGTVLYRSPGAQPYTTIEPDPTSPVHPGEQVHWLGYLGPVDTAWGAVADGKAGVYLRLTDIAAGPSLRDQTVGIITAAARPPGAVVIRGAVAQP